MTDYSIFFIIAIAATGIGALLFLLSLFGLGEHDLDFDADSGGADVGLLSVKSGIGFFLGFGWGGVLAQGLDWGMAASLAAAFCQQMHQAAKGHFSDVEESFMRQILGEVSAETEHFLPLAHFDLNLENYVVEGSWR